jgi:hypothetical protein
MTWPNVTINQLNRQQASIDEIERTLLYIGLASSDIPGDLIALNAQSDLDKSLTGAGDTLRHNVTTAQLNGGQNWQAYALLLPKAATLAAWLDAIRHVQQIISVEGVVATVEIKDAATGRTMIEAFSALRAELTAKFGRWVWFILTVAGPKKITTPATWAAYQAFIATLTNGVAAAGVQIVPSLWGNDAGVLGGRLCNRSVTIADSPARVITGPLLGLGVDSADLPTDSAGVEVELSHLQALHDLRCSVPMWYPDYQGLYWSDGRTLDVNGGDFGVIEDLRVVDKMARRVRLMAIPKIADRSMNSTPASIATHQTHFARPMRDNSRSTQINGVSFPGEVKPPREGDVVITWTDNKTVSIFIVVRPYGSAKSILVGIMLDQTLEG